MTDAYVMEAAGYPRIRVSRVVVDGRRGFDVDFDSDEWADTSEARAMCSWWSPVVQTFADYNALLGRLGFRADEKTSRQLATELLGYMRVFASKGLLRKRGKTWRYTGTARQERDTEAMAPGDLRTGVDMAAGMLHARADKIERSR